MYKISPNGAKKNTFPLWKHLIFWIFINFILFLNSCLNQNKKAILTFWCRFPCCNVFWQLLLPLMTLMFSLIQKLFIGTNSQEILIKMNANVWNWWTFVPKRRHRRFVQLFDGNLTQWWTVSLKWWKNWYSVRSEMEERKKTERHTHSG